MKRVQNEVYEKIGRDTYEKRKRNSSDVIMIHGSVDMIAQIHDEIIFEMDDNPETVLQARNFIKACMEKPPLKGFPVPVIAEESVGYSWGEDMSIDKWLEMRNKQ